jgi:hypothetical protein
MVLPAITDTNIHSTLIESQGVLLRLERQIRRVAALKINDVMDHEDPARPQWVTTLINDKKLTPILYKNHCL